MAPLSTLLTVSLVSSAAAFAPAGVTRPSSKLYENFGFDFAEDQVENTPQIILGEANYKTWLNSVDPDNFMNQQVRCRMLVNNSFEPLWLGARQGSGRINVRIHTSNWVARRSGQRTGAARESTYATLISQTPSTRHTSYLRFLSGPWGAPTSQYALQLGMRRYSECESRRRCDVDASRVSAVREIGQSFGMKCASAVAVPSHRRNV